MEIITPVLTDFNKICRICLGQPKELLNIFSSNLDNLLREFASVKVENEDGLPENLCSFCTNKMKEIAEFKKLCQDSDRSLRIILKQTETKDVNQKLGDFETDTTEAPSTSNIDLSITQPPPKFACQICRLDFSDGTLERDHNKTYHPNKRSHFCYICTKDFSKKYNERSIKKHLPTHRTDKNVKQKLHGDFETHKTEALRTSNKDLSITQPPQKITCKICRLDFSDETMEKDHNETYHPNKGLHFCYICTKDLSKKYTECSIKKHLYRHRTCNVYRKIYKSVSNRELHAGEKSFSCNICLKSFARAEYLRRHMVTHNNVRPYMCQICDKSFARKGGLKVHLTVHNMDKKHMCTWCGKTFKYSHNLANHNRRHSGEKPYTCQMCSRSFHSSTILNAHMLTHTDLKKFNCKACGKKFKRSYDLKVHMRTHTGEKPYGCTICSNRYRMSSHLNDHMKTHKGEKDHICDICGKAFYANSNLNHHKKTHTKERLFGCNLCNKTYIYQSSLIAHVKQVHKSDVPEK